MQILQILNSPVTLIAGFIIAVIAVYFTVQSFISYELDGNESPRLQAFTAIFGTIASIGAVVILGLIIAYFA